MKLLCTACLSLLMMHAFGQINNRTLQTNGSQTSAFSYQSEKQQKLVIKGNLVFTTYSLVMSPLENEISDLEALECNAILKRDTATLKILWARDFTLDDPLNKLVTGKNDFPYYVSLGRIVEEFNAIDNNLVYTSGYESLRRIKPDGSLEVPVKRDYFHTWTRRYGVWKLSTKRHDNERKD